MSEVTLAQSGVVPNQTGLNSLRVDIDFLEIDPDLPGSNILIGAVIHTRKDSNSKWRLFASQGAPFRNTDTSPNRVIIAEPGVNNPDGIDSIVFPVDSEISRVTRVQNRLSGDLGQEVQVCLVIKDKNTPISFTSVKVDGTLTLYDV